ncbi:phage holin family protein [Nannocystis pusilla]|nr:phage holin family protein [Nannocystis pusilla]
MQTGGGRFTLAAMTSLVASCLAFTFGLIVCSALLPGMMVRDLWSAFKAAVICGLLSAVLGKVLFFLLSLVFFFPILISGPLGAFLVQAFVNTILLVITENLVDGVRFVGWRTALWAAIGLTLLQMLVTRAVAG